MQNEPGTQESNFLLPSAVNQQTGT